MAQLTFTQVGDSYQASATVNGDFNIHIERVASGSLSVEISTLQNGEYIGLPNIPQDDCFDRSYHDVVYPKYIRIITKVAPVTNKCVIKEAQ